METAEGPNKIAPRPVPVMWEQLPVTDGIFSEEMTNTKAPDIASRVIRFLCSFKVFLIDRNPAARKGRQSAPHAIQNPPGRQPSITCMAFTLGTMPKVSAKTPAKAMICFCFLLIFFSFLILQKQFEQNKSVLCILLFCARSCASLLFHRKIFFYETKKPAGFLRQAIRRTRGSISFPTRQN